MHHLDRLDVNIAKFKFSMLNIDSKETMGTVILLLQTERLINCMFQRFQPIQIMCPQHQHKSDNSVVHSDVDSKTSTGI